MKRKIQVMSTQETNAIWYEGAHEKSVVGFQQSFTKKTVMSLKVDGVSAYVVHVTFLSVTNKLHRKLIQNGKTIVSFLTTGRIKPLPVLLTVSLRQTLKMIYRWTWKNIITMARLLK